MKLRSRSISICIAKTTKEGEQMLPSTCFAYVARYAALKALRCNHLCIAADPVHGKILPPVVSAAMQPINIAHSTAASLARILLDLTEDPIRNARAPKGVISASAYKRLLSTLYYEVQCRKGNLWLHT